MPASARSLAAYGFYLSLLIGSSVQAGEAIITAQPTSPINSIPTTTVAPPTQPPVPLPAQVARATFTTGLAAREPINQVSHINAGQTVYYFTELTGLQGHVVTHRWEYNGQFQLGMQFPVGGERWRVQSSKSITPNMVGTWSVTVINDNGQILRQDTLSVDSAATPVPTPTPLTPPPLPDTGIPALPVVQPAPHATPPDTKATSQPTSPIIPAPAEPLTSIPPEQQKAPAHRNVETDKQDTPPTTTTTDEKKTPIWDSLKP